MTNSSNPNLTTVSLFKVTSPVTATTRRVVHVWTGSYRDAVRQVAIARGDWRGVKCFAADGRRVY